MKKPVKKQRLKRYFVSYATRTGFGSIIFFAPSLTPEIINEEVSKWEGPDYAILFFTEIK